ncbi:hypothetical protein LXD69_13010 [Flavobacterium sediminilitoris]|uniref:Tetratricopeptide repeat protein n=1 Tax=Flavobacterium sediminilitoris TaxID=2024526 RepID=A0ABY4HJD6_9FLAO|nr:MULTISPECIES: hypothetical protein [Flavobacterium]UOX32954.1 hypothetical protein LXD69_13010 [Flavobacterium sediminilitoris]
MIKSPTHKICFIVLNILIVSFVSCNTLKVSKHTNKYIEYTHNINKAESYVLNGENSKALTYYSKALNIKVKPIAKNCFTAMQVAAVENDKRQFKKFLINGMERGLLPEYFYKDTLLNEYMNKHVGKDFIEKKFQIANQKYKSQINQYMVDTINKLSDLDNKWKIHYLDSLSNIDTVNKALYEKKYDSIVKEIVENKLIPIIQEHGFPEERMIDVYRIGRKNSYSYTFGNNKAKLILIHYYTFPRENNDINNLLKEEVYKGNLPSDLYAEIIDFYALKSDSKSYYNEWHQTKDSTLFEEIDRKRLEIGLLPFNEKAKKYDRGKKTCKEIRENKAYKQIKLFYWCG